MSSKPKIIQDLAHKYDYKIVKGYEKSNIKIELHCNKCNEVRILLSKSFINNPECKSCEKIIEESIKKKNKITEMNVSIRRQAKQIGFKITDWYDSPPENINISCRDCDTTYSRALKTIRNGLTCFTCKKNKIKKSNTKIDSTDNVYLISNYVIKNNDRKNLSYKESQWIDSVRHSLEKEKITLTSYNETTDSFSSNIGIDFVVTPNLYTKKFLLGNSYKESINLFNPNLPLSVNRNTTIQTIEESISLDYFYKQLYIFLEEEFSNLSVDDLQSLYKKIIPNYNIITQETKSNLDISKIINFHSLPNKLKAKIKEGKLIVSFNNGISFSYKIKTGTNKDTFSSWDNLFQEIWTIH